MHVDILMTILKFCLQNSTEAKLDINLDILRNIVEVIKQLKREYWLKFDGKKSSAEDIKSEKEKLRPSKGAIIKSYKVTKENLQLTSDTRTILMRYCFMTFSS